MSEGKVTPPPSKHKLSLCSPLIGVSVVSQHRLGLHCLLKSDELVLTYSSDLGRIWMGDTTNTVTFEQAVEIQPVLTHQSVWSPVWGHI